MLKKLSPHLLGTLALLMIVGSLMTVQPVFAATTSSHTTQLSRHLVTKSSAAYCTSHEETYSNQFDNPYTLLLEIWDNWCNGVVTQQRVTFNVNKPYNYNGGVGYIDFFNPDGSLIQEVSQWASVNSTGINFGTNWSSLTCGYAHAWFRTNSGPTYDLWAFTNCD